MNYKVPDEKLITFIIRKVIKEKGIINSQREFLSLVLRELKQSGIDYRLNGIRLRKIAINKAGVKVEIEYRETGEESKDLKICPVCGNKLVDIYNLTLEGGRIPTGKKCTKCPYWTGINKRVPRRYTFMR
ncbi:MAG: hypothetical protein ACP5G5_03230 [Thermoplasmata archaeon]|jgi:hypothetical protein|nr:hypothetical protein [Thermoplasmatales archaeon]PMP74274.1 MAG: hypothetical protein C0180_04475 [Aciduliprofundum sp.]HEU13185.1 hypothetical protein [Euryarchaeota archaeon]